MVRHAMVGHACDSPMPGGSLFVSIAPMLGPVTLPSDFLALGKRTWVIVAGEQGPHKACRDMDPDWARALRDQCRASGIPFFLKQMARKEPIPPGLLIRQFPSPSSLQQPLPKCSAWEEKRRSTKGQKK